MMAGFIHFDCLCGLDIYFFGDLPSGKPPIAAIEKLRSQLGNRQYAIYTTQDDEIVPCPCCDSYIQLPDAQIAAYFGKMSLANSNMGADGSPSHVNHGNQRPSRFSDGYSLQSTELN